MQGVLFYLNNHSYSYMFLDDSDKKAAYALQKKNNSDNAMILACLFCFLWSICEGTFFFVIPDVAISYASCKGWRVATISLLAVVIGSMLAAIFLYEWMSYSPDANACLKKIWSCLPGFYPSMLEVAKQHIQTNQASGLMDGPTSGIPYRYYVLTAFEQHISLASILYWTPTARLERVLITPVIVLSLKWFLQKISKHVTALNDHTISIIHYALITSYWIGLYTWYWMYFLPTKYGS